MNSKKTFFIILIISCIFFVSCENGKTSDIDKHSTKTIRIQYSDVIAHTVPNLIMLNGFLEPYLPNDIQVEWVRMPTAPDIRDALLTGNIDIGTFSSITFISAVENGLPLVPICNSMQVTGELYASDPNIDNLRDFSQSSRLAVQSLGSSYHLSLKVASKEMFDDYNYFDNALITMQPSDILTAVLTSTDLSGAIFTFPYSAKAQELENIHFVLDLTPYMQENGMTTFNVVRSNFYEENADFIEIYLKAQRDAVDFISQQPTESAVILADLYGVEASHIEEILRLYPPQLEISESRYNKLAEICYETGILSEAPKNFSALPNYTNVIKAD